MARINNHLVIMAGGVGSRFWPMSTMEKPKQFIDVLGIGKSLLQLTVERFATIVDPTNVWVVTNKNYAATVAEQLPDMPKDHILCEPCRRNTAPCIAYVSWRIKSKDPKANIVVSPSDHIVMNVEEFRRVITDCMKFTSDSDAIVTLGMKPTRPETGYGYIEANLSASSLRNKGIFRVDSFREKPDLETAKKYISKNNYFNYVLAGSDFLKVLRIKDFKASFSKGKLTLDFVTEFSKPLGPDWTMLVIVVADPTNYIQMTTDMEKAEIASPKSLEVEYFTDSLEGLSLFSAFRSEIEGLYLRYKKK